MKRYFFPRNLADKVADRWNHLVIGQYDLPPCPSRKVLKQILEVCYLASLETEEARQLIFSICCTPEIDEVRCHNSNDLVEAWAFDSDRALTIGEVRRLATTASSESVAIWLRYVDQPDPKAVIHGLINPGSSWMTARRALSYSYASPPSALIIRVSGPGRLAIYQGLFRIATLSSGHIKLSSPEDTPAISFYGVHSFFEEGTALLREYIEPPQYEPLNEWYNFEWICYLNVIVGIVNIIQQMKHGGTLVLIRQSFISEENFETIFRIKYRFSRNTYPLRERYIDFLQKRQYIADAYYATEGEAPDTNPLDALALLRSEKSLQDTIAFIGNLSGTDGAIVMTNTLELIGFGAEIASSHTYPNKVYTSVDLLGRKKQEFDVQQFGMRHRSALRLCASTDQVFAFVVSQDGDVSIVWRSGDNIMIKRNIDITNANMVLA
ncbi:MAG TPA: hypothetical protein VGD69_19895 [Herpetosiphonaceae bacterium]